VIFPTHPGLRQNFAKVSKLSLVPRKHGEERKREKEREMERRS